jgi:uncharacterized protein (UPF0261 family)
MDTKSNEARFVANVLAHAGATPWIVDLSMKSHTLSAADVSGARVAAAVGACWHVINERSRPAAIEPGVMEFLNSAPFFRLIGDFLLFCCFVAFVIAVMIAAAILFG